ncbi:MAG: TonB-dependent receptor [Acidimicrobiia bacterium]|nr:TonB-dependent receptor [Acidimicrobiia bacterium]
MRNFCFAAKAAACLIICACSLFGQARNGTILGTVFDSTGAALPNAKVVVTETNTGVSRTGQTTAVGYFAFPDLLPGLYSVSAEFTGFKKAVRQELALLVNSTARVDLTLEPGNVNESINVSAEIPLLQTDRTDTGRKLETRQIADMPLGFNRNFQSLLNLVPGTTRAFRPHSVFFNSQDSLSTQVNGQSRLANNVQFEGVDNNHRTGLLTVIIPPIEALSTVDVTTSNYEAELGRAGGAVTNIALKSGTNEIHGSGFWFNSLSAYGARNFFQRTIPVTTYNYVGGTLGGPIVRNKTFYFGDYLRIWDRRGQGNRFTLPTGQFRNGDFSGATTLIYDPATGVPDGARRQPFAGNRLPASRITPLSQKVMALVPLPNLPGTGVNFDQNSVLSKDTDSFDVKIDHNQTENDRITVRYSFQRPVVTDPPIFGLAGGPRGGGFQGTGTNKTQSTALNYTKVLSPTLLSEFRLGVSRYKNVALNADYGSKASEALGVRGVNLDNWTSGLFSVEVDGGFSNPLVGYSASLPWDRAETNFNLVNNWTKTVRSHTIKWGADIRRVRDDLNQTQTFNPRGVFRYGPGTTGCRTECSGATTASFANSFASFLLDIPRQAGRDLSIIYPAWRQTQWFFYAHDKWQISRKMTLDLGLRWEYYQPATPRFPGGFSNYDPDTNSLVLAGIGNNPMDLGLRKNRRNFAPRGGISYRFDERTVLRAGFGISFLPYPDNTYAYNFPVRQNNAFNQTSTFTPAITAAGQVVNMASGFPAPIPAEIPSNGIIANAALAQNYDVINKDFREGNVQSWNLAVQRSLPNQFVLEAAYVANHGVRVPTQYQLNAGLIAGAGSNGQPLFQRFRKTASANLRFMGTSSNYHSLQVKLDRRFAGGFLMTTAYTWSKAIGFTDENGGYSFYINPERSRAELGFSRRHTYVQSYIYELPFGKGRRWMNSGPAAWILGGWQANGILTLMSGPRINFSYTTASINAPNNSQTPNITGAVRVLSGVDDALWFDTSNFSAPANGVFGNLGRNPFSGPGFFNLDGSLFKMFQVGERTKMELRGEFFSVTNTPQFNNPNGEFGNANFGRIRGAGGNRGGQLGLRILF